MNVAEFFKVELENTAPELLVLIDNIQPTGYGCSYLFDGFMECHIVRHQNHYWDVQDQIDPWLNIQKYSAYPSIQALVLNMKKSLS